MTHARLRLALFLVCLLPTLAYAGEPLGIFANLPGFSREQSRLTYEAGQKLVAAAQGQQADKPLLQGRGLICALAQMMQGSIEAEVVRYSKEMTAGQVGNARKAISYLREVQEKHCDRPKGGGGGSGNEGDQLVAAFVKQHSGTTRHRVAEARHRLREWVGLPEASLAQELALVGAVVVAGALAVPTLAFP